MSPDASSAEIFRRLEEQKYALDQSAIVAHTDSQGVITYVNEKFCEISGYSRGELIGKTHKIVNSGFHSKEFWHQVWSTISAGVTWKGEICNRAKNGSQYWVQTTIVPFVGRDGKPEQYLAIRQDVTRLKEAEEIIMAQQSKLVTNSKLSAIGEMAAAITHEINNPLGVILGRCEMMKSLLEREQVDLVNMSRLVDTIEVTGRRIEKIVKSMKSLAHQGDEDPFLPTPVKLILEDVLDLFFERFRNHGIQLTIAEYDPGLIVECRSHEVLQVLVNLLTNSFDAIKDLQKKWTRIEVRTKGSDLEISVTDSGPGIASDVAAKLFMPFFSTKKVQYGTGLGLSISQNLMRRHRGDIKYDSSSPFTRFVVTLPLEQKGVLRIRTVAREV